MTTATNVSAGKPKVGGAIFAAPVGTSLPTSATEELNEAFKSLGYCSDDGLTNSTSLETEKIKAWGGDTVLIINKSKDDTFKWKLIEAKNKEVLAYVYGDDNVSGTLETGLKVKVNSSDVPERSIVIDMIMRGDTLKRIVIVRYPRLVILHMVMTAQLAMRQLLTVHLMQTAILTSSISRKRAHHQHNIWRIKYENQDKERICH